MPDLFKNRLGDLIVGILSLLSGAAVLVWLLNKLTFSTPLAFHPDITYVTVSVLLAICIGAGARLILSPLLSRTPVPAASQPDPDVALRTRIAPLVIIAGVASITILTITILIAFAIVANSIETLKAKLDTVYLGLFSSVLPVFATWVGTVLAFYFTNESFRQAAAAARDAAPQQRITQKATDRWIPYAKIAKIETPAGVARSTGMADVIALFNAQVSRVIIFDEAKHPLFIIRKRLVPEAWFSALPPGATVDTYLKLDSNEKDSKRFGSAPQSATLDDVRSVASKETADDVFITAGGSKAEPVLGWITDEILRSP